MLRPTRAQFIKTSIAPLGLVALTRVFPSRLVSAEHGAPLATVRTHSRGEPANVDLREFIHWIQEAFEPCVRSRAERVATLVSRESQRDGGGAKFPRTPGGRHRTSRLILDRRPFI